MRWAPQRLRALWWSSRWTVVLAVGLVGGLVWALQSGADRALPLLLVVVAVIAILLLWQVPRWQVRRLAISTERRFELENEARKTVAQIVGGAVFLAGLYFTAQSLRTGQEALRVNQEGQITERFTKAIEQLGSEKLQIRLGGIYALERIARDSERDLGPIMEVLTAYVRENASLKKQPTLEAKAAAPVKAAEELKKTPAADIQAILTVLGRRTGRWSRTHLDLRRTDLAGADLSDANLEGAILSEADLRGALLFRANLRGANLIGASLGEARLLTQGQIDSAFTDRSTVCPIGLKCGK